ncbi:hypothetical protein ACFL5B_02615 [Candidatus Latescibacterota bacterium]
MKSKEEKGFDFGVLGIALGVLFVIASVVWIIILNISRDDDRSGVGITWVG